MTSALEMPAIAAESLRRLLYEAAHGGWEFPHLGGRALLDHVGREAVLEPGHRVADLSPGPGDAATYLTARYGCRVTAVGVDPRWAERCRARLSRLEPRWLSRLELRPESPESWHPAGGFTAACAFDALGRGLSPEAVSAAAGRALDPGGVLVWTVVTGGGEVEVHRERLAAGFAATFEGARLDTVNYLAERFCARVSTALARGRGEILHRHGDVAYTAWARWADSCHEAFARGRLAYLRCTARRRGGGAVPAAAYAARRAKKKKTTPHGKGHPR